MSRRFNFLRLISFRDDNGKSRVLSGGLNLFAALFLGLCLTARGEPGEPLRIVVAGDGRSDFPDRNDPNHLSSPRSEDKNGMNDVISREICTAAKTEKASILLWTGDISNVLSEDAKVLEQQLVAWCDIMRPLYDQGVKVLPTRGNHEVFWYDQCYKEHEIPEAKNTWTKVFSGSNALQATGVDPESLSFYYVQGSVLMIGLDQYENEYDHSVNQRWLDDVLKKNKKRFIFAYGHEPAFAAGGRHGTADTLAAWPQKRDEMWKRLNEAGAQIYFCGHDHFYDRMRVRSVKRGREMQQITAGTAGAPFYCKGDYPIDQNWKLECKKHLDFIYGYILITVDGNKATIEFKGRELNGQYTVKDSFCYTAGTP